MNTSAAFIDGSSLRTTCLPWTKWVGGKRQLLDQILPRVPSSFTRYWEPFVGGGAVFFALGLNNVKDCFLSDTNGELVNCYKVIRDDVSSLVKVLKGGLFVYDKETYYKIRAWEPQACSDVMRAARFVYLLKTGFNGLWRVNRKGEFNVPMGKYNNPTICDEETLYACSKALERVHINAWDFAWIGDRNVMIEHWNVSEVKPGDFVYFDPPYAPVNATSNFTGYAQDGFGLKDHERLADFYRELSRRGVKCLLSNADVPLVHKLYGGFDFYIDRVEARRNVNSKGDKRGKVGEVLIRNYSL
jgi:DNA adenine methylase